MRIAYLVLAHQNLNQLYELTDALNFKDDKVFIHIDAKCKEIFDHTKTNNKNVVLLKKRVYTNWAGYSLVNATMSLLETSSKDIFDYFIILSGQCFPIKSNKYIHEFFENNKGKIFMDYKELPDSSLSDGGMDKYWYPVFFDQLRFWDNKYRKLINSVLKKTFRLIHYKRKIPVEIKPCFGSQWWAINTLAASFLIDYVKENKKTLKYFKYSWAPDELMIQSIINNSTFNSITINRPFRYIDWNTNGPPKTLTLTDFEKINQSEFLFARKFDNFLSKDLIEKIKKEIH
jgi:hypothetical protein